MYSRYGGNSNRPVRLPERYGGSAFSQGPTEPITVTKREPLKSFPRGGVEEKASPIADRMLRADGETASGEDSIPIPTVPALSDITDQTVEEVEGEEATVPPPTKKTSASPINFEGLRRLLGGGGEGEQDRLLLLGLILLLSRSGEDSDILLWLSLLLLCG